MAMARMSSALILSLAGGCSGVVLDSTGPFVFHKNIATKEATVGSLALDPSQIDKLDRERVLVTLPRARLGNRLFEVAALLSIAKELRSKAVIPMNRYTPENTPQMAKLKHLFFDLNDVERLSDTAHSLGLCHTWDKFPMVLDTNISKLGEWSGTDEEKGTIHVPATIKQEHFSNKATDWAEGIRVTKINGKHCQVTELDGFFQQHEFIDHHFEWIRDLFWHEETAAKAKKAFNEILSNGNISNSFTPVGLHLRLTDYVKTHRNLNFGYYRNAMRELKKKHRSAKMACLVFSDDVRLAIEIVKKLPACDRVVPVEEWPGKLEGGRPRRGQPKVDDKVSFFMMAQMKSLVIADSSYSYWAARLNPNNPFVVAPKIEKYHAAEAFDYLEVPAWTKIPTTPGAMQHPEVKKAMNLMRNDAEVAAIRNSEWAE